MARKLSVGILVFDDVEVLDFAVGRGWRVGIHAIGDRAVRLVLDA